MNNGQTLFRFRPSQARILDYNGGLMGVAAVPGSGKTFTLSHLAARLVQKLGARGVLDEQEVLIVTFANSAVNSFKNKIAQILQHERGLLPYVGYRVRTLHGLAHDIVRERPTLVGLSEDFQIVDERVAFAIRRDTVLAHLPEWRDRLTWLLNEELGENRQKGVLNRDFPEALVELVSRFISRFKEQDLTPEAALGKIAGDSTFTLLHFAVEVYVDYQRSLAYRGAVDFDDLVRLALFALATDSEYKMRLQQRWIYILEDEAQDSSYLQEQMLTYLTGSRNWVRVGDPNQAINTTFTTSNPKYLRDFLRRKEVLEVPLHTSGRSAPKIIRLANQLVEWTVNRHPVVSVREETFYPQTIQPTASGDAQPNPADSIANIYIQAADKPRTPDEELEAVVRSLASWLPNNADKTVAVLVPENSRGFKLTERLQQVGLVYEELLRSTTETREAASQIGTVLGYLADPRQPAALARVFRDVWLNVIGYVSPLDAEEDTVPTELFRAITRIKQVEAFIWSSSHDDPVNILNLPDLPPEWVEEVNRFVTRIQIWLRALSLPIDQLVLTLGQDLFSTPRDIALAYKIARLLKGTAEANPHWRLVQFVEELRLISENQRKFIGFDDAESGYEPKRGIITVSTLHAAKGLEWDRVYLMGINNYSFPSALDYDEFISEKWFIRDKLNLEAEVLAQLEAVVDGNINHYHTGSASHRARLDYTAERLRLLYVGITRARHDLIITWNTGRYYERGGAAIKQAAQPLIYLRGLLENEFED